MKLYGSPISTCTRKVLCTLAEKGAQADFVNIELFKGEQKNADYMTVHQPFGRVPAIEDDGFSMYESRAIIRYLDATLPGTKLVPPESAGRMWEFVRGKIAERDEFNARVAALTGAALPEWAGRD